MEVPEDGPGEGQIPHTEDDILTEEDLRDIQEDLSHIEVTNGDSSQ